MVVWLCWVVSVIKELHFIIKELQYCENFALKEVIKIFCYGTRTGIRWKYTHPRAGGPAHPRRTRETLPRAPDQITRPPVGGRRCPTVLQLGGGDGSLPTFGPGWVYNGCVCVCMHLCQWFCVFVRVSSNYPVITWFISVLKQSFSTYLCAILSDVPAYKSWYWLRIFWRFVNFFVIITALSFCYGLHPINLLHATIILNCWTDNEAISAAL